MVCAMVPSFFISILLGIFGVASCTNTTFGTRTTSTVSNISSVTPLVNESTSVLQRDYTSKYDTHKDNSLKKLFRFKRSPGYKANGDNNKEAALSGNDIASLRNTRMPEQGVTTTRSLALSMKPPITSGHEAFDAMSSTTSENPTVSLTVMSSIVPSIITEDTTMTPTLTEDTTMTPTVNEDTTMTPTITEDTTMTPTVNEDTTMTPTVNEDTTMTPTVNEDTTMTPTITEDTTMTPTVTEDTTMTPTITEDTTMTPTTTEDTTMTRTVTEDTTMTPTTTEDTTMTPTVNEDTTMTPTITEDTTMTPTVTEDTTMTPTVTEDTTMTPTITDEDTTMTPTVTEDTTMPPTVTEDTTMPSSTSEESSSENTSDKVTIETTTEAVTTKTTTELVTVKSTTGVNTSNSTPQETTFGNITDKPTLVTSTDIATTNGTYVPTTGTPPASTQPPEVDRDVAVEVVAGILGVLLMGGLGATGAVMYRQGKLPWKARNSHGSVRPHPIHLSRFDNHCSQLLETPARLGSEFQLLQTLSADVVDTNTFVAAQLPDNKKKNRYINILPYDLTRVKLEVSNDDPSDYVNASYIKGYSNTVEYIASQGPKEETLDDFWRMMHQHNVRVIAMVTNFEEGGKRKCEPYFPKLRDQMLVGDSIIRCTTELHFPMYTQRTIVMHKDDKKRSITHLHFNEWPDFGCPEGTDAMLQFCGTLRHHITNNPPGLALVHCSAGVGRTGTLIALDILLQHIQENKKVDIFGTVYKLRKQRTNMVQTEGQYAYIYKCIKDALQDSTLFKQENSPTNSLEPIYENVPTKLTTFIYEKLPDTKGKLNSSESECEL